MNTIKAGIIGFGYMGHFHLNKARQLEELDVVSAYDIDAEKMTRVLNISREKMSDKAVKSAAKHVDPMRSQTGMGRDEVVARLVNAAVRVTM